MQLLYDVINAHQRFETRLVCPSPPPPLPELQARRPLLCWKSNYTVGPFFPTGRPGIRVASPCKICSVTSPLLQHPFDLGKFPLFSAPVSSLRGGDDEDSGGAPLERKCYVSAEPWCVHTSFSSLPLLTQSPFNMTWVGPSEATASCRASLFAPSCTRLGKHVLKTLL